jgi:drug/metabolite transporter (DMT)-like permease
MGKTSQKKVKGIYAALASAFFLGMTPVFGKQAITLGMPPIGVVALRTILATALLLFGVLIFKRQYLYIYPAGLLGCLLAGGINGIGSLLFYGALGRIGAGLGQIIYSIYPLFVVLWLWLDHQPPSRLTLLRLILIIPALYLLIQTASGSIDYLGVGMMLGAALLYALHLPINQRVLYDMPAPTVTLYTLLSMSGVVILTFIISRSPYPPGSIDKAWLPVLGLTLMTFLSRLTLFLGVKHIGGSQTALLGLGELIITLVFSFIWLGERLSPYQWSGAFILVLSLALVGLEKSPTLKRGKEGWLSWVRPPGLPRDLPWPQD